MKRKPYPTDLTDAQWQLLEPLIPPPKPGGPHRTVNIREVINGILYLVRSGCSWRMLPHDFPPWGTVHYYYWCWRRDGTWQQIHDTLRTQVRQAEERPDSPSAALIDSQSVPTTEVGGPRGFDKGKNVKGRKRHLVGDTLGLILAVVVHAANIQDRDGARLVLALMKDRFPRLRLIWADGSYTGALIAWVQATFQWVLEIVRRPSHAQGFILLPHRWIVERTFAWLGRYRRLSKDYERLPASSEAMIYLAMINLMLHQLQPG